MSSRAPDLLSSIFSTERLTGVPPPFHGAIAMKVRRPDAEPLEIAELPVTKRRTAIWEMHPSVHCSIIGTCLSAGELQRLLIKLGVDGAAAADDHTLHKQAVALAGKQQGGENSSKRRLTAAMRRPSNNAPSSRTRMRFCDVGRTPLSAAKFRALIGRC